MKLVNQEEINKIAGCPSQNYTGSLKLFRWVSSEDMLNSFECYATSKPKFANDCIAWGLSTYRSKKSAIEVLKNLSIGMQRKFDAIAVCEIEENDGIKYQSRDNINHYTFFPRTNFDSVSRFNIIEILSDEKQ